MSTTAFTSGISSDPFRRSKTVREGSPALGPLSNGADEPRLKSGDVLVSRPTARADVYKTSVVPAAAHITDNSYESAKNSGGQLARELAVDAWFTCDHTHAVRFAHHRIEGMTGFQLLSPTLRQVDQ
jgi:hypothetical protein